MTPTSQAKCSFQRGVRCRLNVTFILTLVVAHAGAVAAVVHETLLELIVNKEI